MKERFLSGGRLLCGALVLTSYLGAHELRAGVADEQSAAFSIRFEKLPSETAVVAGIACSADAAGRLKLVYKALPTEIVGDYVVETPGPVAKPGEWLHVESSYSLIRRRTALHVNGVYQWENDNLNLPRL